MFFRADRQASATEGEGGADGRRGGRLLPQRPQAVQDRRGHQQEGPADHYVSRSAREVENRHPKIKHDDFWPIVLIVFFEEPIYFCSEYIHVQYVRY